MIFEDYVRQTVLNTVNLDESIVTKYVIRNKKRVIKRKTNDEEHKHIQYINGQPVELNNTPEYIKMKKMAWLHRSGAAKKQSLLTRKKIALSRHEGEKQGLYAHERP